MKKILLFCSISLLLHFPLYSQTSFIKTQSIALPLPGGNAPYNITSGLIDDDEYPDLVISTTLGDSVYWLKNNGTGAFTPDTNIVSLNTKDYIFSVMAEDVDNDGSLDILVTDLLGSPSWFTRTEITPGTATYTETVLVTTIANPACLDLQDLDNDGFSDFVLSSATSGAGNDIVWYKNNGDGTFGSEIVIDATQSQAYTFTFSDFENDGDIDIASIAYNDDKVNVFNNQLIVLSTDETTFKDISIYPNPVKYQLYFTGFLDTFSVSVYDVWGKNLLNESLGFDESLDVSSLPSGIYFISFKNHTETFKFIKH